MSATAFQRMRREVEARRLKESNKKENSLKVAEIKELLDKKGINYDSKGKKEELIKLLEGAE